MKNLVSVIILTYNRSAMLKNAIESVLNQSHNRFELIIVDDGSTDDTGDTVAKYDDDRIVYLKRPHTGVVSYNRNVGLEYAKSEFIAFLDSDDTWHELKLEMQLELMQDASVGYTFCNTTLVDESTDRTYKSSSRYLNGKQQPFKKNLLKDIIFNELAIYPSSLMIRKSVLEEVAPFDTSRSISEMDFIGRIAVNQVCYLDPNPWVSIVKHGGNTSAKVIEKLYEEKIVLAQKLLSEKKISKRDYKKSLALHYYAMALVLPDGKSIRDALKKCIHHRPFFLRAYYQMIRTAY